MIQERYCKLENIVKLGVCGNLGGIIKIFFTCHGSMADSRELTVLMGQNVVFGTMGYSDFTTSEKTKKG